MISRDLLRELFEKKISEEDAAELLDNVLDSSDGRNTESVLMFTRAEWTAYGHGAGLSDLARWRYQGWPSKCVRCGREIALDRFGWKVVERNGLSVLEHIRCP
jgi:hypothetical protein